MNPTAQIFAARVGVPEGAAFEQWIQLTDAPALLRADLDLDPVVLYNSVGGTFMHAVLVPSAELAPPDFNFGGQSNPASFIAHDWRKMSEACVTDDRSST